MRKIKYAVVHWSASYQATTVEDIRRWHVNGNGWSDIGYHRIILYPKSKNQYWHELVKLGRPEEKAGAHVYPPPGVTRESLGICVVGGSDYKLHPLQKEAIRHTVIILAARFGFSVSATKCHRDFAPTQCPGDEIYHIVTQLREAYA